MALYIGSVKYAPTRAIYRGFWAINVHGFAGTEVDFNGIKQYIGSNEITYFKVTNEGRYIIRATRQGQVKTRIIVIAKQDTDYIKDIGMYVGFKEVQYIESSGTQYIDTGFVPTSNTKIVAKAKSLNHIMGCRGADASSNAISLRYISTYYAADFNNSNYSTYRAQYTAASTTVVTIEASKQSRKIYDINGSVVAQNNTVCSDTFNPTNSIWLFGVNGITDLGTSTIYSAQIYENGTLVRDFIPVVDDTNTPCMYDRVSQTMYYNAGTGTFTAGPDMYQELQYIQGVNNTQYINTGIIPTSSMTYYAKFSPVSSTAAITSSNWSGFGARQTAGGDDGICFFGGASQNTRVDVAYFDSVVATNRWRLNEVTAFGDIYEVSVVNSLAEIKKNGSVLGTHQFTPDATCNISLYVNGLNNAGSPMDAHKTMTLRQYRFTVDGYIDLIPVKRLTDNAVGMYDIINNKFYGNAGTGSFTAGPAKE